MLQLKTKNKCRPVLDEMKKNAVVREEFVDEIGWRENGVNVLSRKLFKDFVHLTSAQ